MEITERNIFLAEGEALVWERESQKTNRFLRFDRFDDGRITKRPLGTKTAAMMILRNEFGFIPIGLTKLGDRNWKLAPNQFDNALEKLLAGSVQ